ncbi:MAG TPA: N-acetyltransferase [Streptosporangiaceae bacterium]|nr:N-acetyltransferase [Streptosporangiaceae bacterium]
MEQHGPAEPRGPGGPPTPGGQDSPKLFVADAAGQAADPGFVAAAHRILASLVRDGAALGWLDPPSEAEVAALLRSLGDAAPAGNAALCAAYAHVAGPAVPSGGMSATGAIPGSRWPSPDTLVGLGYWTRYERPTHRPHADVRRVAVASHAQGRGVGRALTRALIASARAAGVEVLTLDVRGDNAGALHLYRSLGFTQYGRLKDFVAAGSRRYDTVFCALDLREHPGAAPG